MKNRTVSEVMTEQVVRAHPGTPFKEITKALRSRQISGLPVVDEYDRVLGVISESDLMARQAGLGERDGRLLHLPTLRRTARRAQRKARAMTAEQLMSHPAVTVGRQDAIAAAARAMVRHSVERLPVVDADGRLAGIVTRRDLLQVFLRPDPEIHDEVVDTVFVRTLWLSPETVGVSVDDGVVTLRGQLERRSEVALAVQMTGQIDGVVGVTNHLAHRIDDYRPRPDDRGSRLAHGQQNI